MPRALPAPNAETRALCAIAALILVACSDTNADGVGANDPGVGDASSPSAGGGPSGTDASAPSSDAAATADAGAPSDAGKPSDAGGPRDGGPNADAGCGSRAMTSYTTTFPLGENPIAEGCSWINGRVAGLDWYDVATTPGRAHGVQSTSNPAYCDPTALLAGTWGPDQTAEGTVYCDNPTSSYYQEVELRLRSTLSAHKATGYEVMFRCLKTSDGYTYIARWNGALGDFKVLGGQGGLGVATGDVVKATIVGNTITAYINGVQVAQAQDGTFVEGSPGIGFNYGVGPTFTDFGFTRFQATAP